jgi:uncharacterized phage protein (TIGR02216 family)
MAFGLGVLRFEPSAFWSMTLVELKAAVRGMRGVAGAGDPMDRGVLDALLHAYPDLPLPASPLPDFAERTRHG